MKPTANQVARAATLAAHVGYTYDELDCQAFVEHCVRQAGGRMDYLGTNDMARRAAWLGTLDEARAQGRLVPGAGCAGEDGVVERRGLRRLDPRNARNLTPHI